MSFIWPWMLLTLLLIPVFVGLYLRLIQNRKQAAANLGPLGTVQNQSGQKMGRRRHMPALCFLLGLMFLFVGLARPEMFVNLPRVEGTVILAFDISNSMLADDLEPSRIEAAKTAARTFVENQPSTIMIGVVAFSNGGLVVQPPTSIQADILATIERLNPQGGTSLGQGIFTSLNAIAGEALAIDVAGLEEADAEVDEQRVQIGSYPSSVILLLSDGENTGEPDPLAIAQVAAEASVRVYSVGIGSPEGAVIEVDGFSILSQLNEKPLQDIANLTNGSYYHAEDAEALQEIYENVDLQLTIDGQKMEVTAIIAGIGLLLFLIGALLSMIWFGRMP